MTLGQKESANYYDQGNIRKEWVTKKGHKATMGQEWEAEEEDLEIFQGLEKKEPKASWKSLKGICWERAKVPCQKEKGEP